jgi:hypothetical protein
MKRFFTVLAAAAVAGAIYVATAPGSQTAAAPTLRQFNALVAKVTKLQKDEAKVKKVALIDAFLLSDCMNTAVPIGEYGDIVNNPATSGYTYTDPTINSGTPFLTTALDVAANNDPNAFWITGSPAPSACATDLAPALRKLSRIAGIHLHVSALHSFIAHRH